jgi:hypothetical protein
MNESLDVSRLGELMTPEGRLGLTVAALVMATELI